MAQSVTLERVRDRGLQHKPRFHTGTHSVPARQCLPRTPKRLMRGGAAGPDWLIDDFRELPTTIVLNAFYRMPV